MQNSRRNVAGGGVTCQLSLRFFSSSERELLRTRGRVTEGRKVRGAAQCFAYARCMPLSAAPSLLGAEAKGDTDRLMPDVARV